MITPHRTSDSRRRALPRFAVLALLVAACSAGGGGTTTTASTPGDPVVSTSTSTSSSTTTTEALAPAAVDLVLTEVVATDPLETILPLTGVSVAVNADGHYVFTFSETQFGAVGVRFIGLPETDFASCDWSSEDNFPGEGEGTSCFYQTADGFEVTDPVSNGDAPPVSVVVALEVTMDSVTITIGDMTFTGTGLRFDDGPLFVQIDPNTGGLAEPVTRRAGEISAADLYAALSG